MSEKCPFCGFVGEGNSPPHVKLELTRHIVRDHIDNMMEVVVNKRLDVLTKMFWECIDEE